MDLLKRLGAMVASKVNDEAFYALAMDELEAGILRKGLWAKAMADNDMDKERAQAAYIKMRVQVLKTKAPHVFQKMAEVNETRARLDAVAEPLAAMESKVQSTTDEYQQVCRNIERDERRQFDLQVFCGTRRKNMWVGVACGALCGFGAGIARGSILDECWRCGLEGSIGGTHAAISWSMASVGAVIGWVVAGTRWLRRGKNRSSLQDLRSLSWKLYQQREQQTHLREQLSSFRSGRDRLTEDRNKAREQLCQLESDVHDLLS